MRKLTKRCVLAVLFASFFISNSSLLAQAEEPSDTDLANYTISKPDASPLREPISGIWTGANDESSNEEFCGNGLYNTYHSCEEYSGFNVKLDFDSNKEYKGTKKIYVANDYNKFSFLENNTLNITGSFNYTKTEGQAAIINSYVFIDGYNELDSNPEEVKANSNTILLTDNNNQYYFNQLISGSADFFISDKTGKAMANNNKIEMGQVKINSNEIYAGMASGCSGYDDNILHNAEANNNELIINKTSIHSYDGENEKSDFFAGFAFSAGGNVGSSNNNITITEGNFEKVFSLHGGHAETDSSNVSHGYKAEANNNKVMISNGSSFTVGKLSSIYGGLAILHYEEETNKELKEEASGNSIKIEDSSFNLSEGADGEYTELVVSSASIETYLGIDEGSGNKLKVIANNNSIELKNIESDLMMSLKAVDFYKVPEELPNLDFSLCNNSVTLNNVKLNKAAIKGIDYPYELLEGKNTENNSLIVKGCDNTIERFSGFDHFVFELPEDDADYCGKSLLKAEYLDFMWLSSANPIVDLKLSDKQKDLINAGEEPLTLFESSSIVNSSDVKFQFKINDIPLTSPNQYVGDARNNDLFTGIKYFGFDFIDNTKLVYGNYTLSISTPTFVYLDENGEKHFGNPNKKDELVLTADHANLETIFAIDSDYREATKEELAALAPKIRINTNHLDLSTTQLYGFDGIESGAAFGTLEVEAADVRVNSASCFANYDFILKSEYNGQTMLHQEYCYFVVKDNGISLTAKIDPDDCNFDKIVLIDNILIINEFLYPPQYIKFNDNGQKKDSLTVFTQETENLIKRSTFTFDKTIEPYDKDYDALKIAVVADNKLFFAGEHARQDGKVIGKDDFVIDDSIVHDTVLEDLTEMYGKFSDAGHATGEHSSIGSGINLDWITYKGGHCEQSGCDDTTNNRIDFTGKGAKFKNICNFQFLEFNADSRTKDAVSDANFSFLNTKEEVDLGEFSSLLDNKVEKRRVNFTADKFSLGRGERLVLMNSVKNKSQADFCLDGVNVSERQRLYVGEVVENGANQYVQVTDISFDDSKANEVALIGGDTDIQTASFIDQKGSHLSTASSTLIVSADAIPANNRLAVTNVDAEGNEHVYGGYSVNPDVDATHTTIKFTGNVNKPNTIYHGSYNMVKDKLVATDNSLEVGGINNNVKGISDFANMNFVLPDSVKWGDTMLTVANKVDLKPTEKVSVSATAKAVGALKNSFKEGKVVTLLKSEAGLENTEKLALDTTKVDIESLTTISAKAAVSQDKKSLEFTLGEKETPAPVDPAVDERTNDKTKAPAEAVAASIAMIGDNNDLISGKLVQNMSNIHRGGTETFAATSGGKTRLKSGSHVDSNHWNIGAGIAKKGLSKKNPNTTYGFFVNYGSSKFDTYNNGFVGNGKSKVSDLGLMFHSQGKNDYYYHGAVFVGKAKTKWDSALGGYDTDATFRGFNIGMGHKHTLNSGKVLDLYGRYMFSHMNGMSVKIDAYDYHFNSAESSRLRLGFRVDAGKKDCKFKPFYGLAVEREFNSDANASMNLGKVDAPSLKGNTGILEAGFNWTRGPWDFNFTVEGTCGKRQGVAGSLSAYYNF